MKIDKGMTLMKKNKVTLFDFIVLILIICILIPFASVLPTIVIALLILILFVTALCIKNMLKKKINTTRGITTLHNEEKGQKQKEEKVHYESALFEKNQSPSERYKIEWDIINNFLDLGTDLVENQIAEGIYMQNSEAPQSDWSIAGGIASGLAGSAAGVATAMDIMQKNAKATHDRHEEGKNIEKHGRELLKRINKDKIDLKSQHYDEFEFTELMPELLEHINVICNEVINYGTGYIELKAFVFTDSSMNFPESNREAKIDGSICINLYEKDSKNLIARGYYNPPGRYGNDRLVTGFRKEKKEETIVLKLEEGMNFNKQYGYTISISEPKLWLLKV